MILVESLKVARLLYSNTLIPDQWVSQENVVEYCYQIIFSMWEVDGASAVLNIILKGHNS